MELADFGIKLVHVILGKHLCISELWTLKSLGMADGYRYIIVMCLLLFPLYRKYCSHVDEKKIESLALLENDLSTFK